MIETVVSTLPAISLSDIGCVREDNQDAILISLEHRCCIVADGVGGMTGGALASDTAVEAFYRYLKGHIDILPSLEVVYQGVAYANERVYRLSSEGELAQSMGTTLCVLLFVDDMAICAHVGDSRIYRLRNGLLEQLTRDHRLSTEVLSHDAHDPFLSKVITRALGIAPVVEPELSVKESMAGDLYMLCTDGLSDHLSDSEITGMLAAYPIHEAAERLVAAVKQKGGYDNITLGIMEVV